MLINLMVGLYSTGVAAHAEDGLEDSYRGTNYIKALFYPFLRVVFEPQEVKTSLRRRIQRCLGQFLFKNT